MNFTEEARKLYADINFGTEMLAAALQSAYERGEQSGREEERERVLKTIQDYPMDHDGWSYELIDILHRYGARS